MKLCKCGCGTQISDDKKFVDTSHYWVWKRTQKHKPHAQKTNINIPDSTSKGHERVCNDTIIFNEDGDKKPSWIKRMFTRKLKEIQYPKKLLTTKEIRELKQKQEAENLTDEQKFLRFFGNLPVWTTKKPGFITQWRLGKESRHVVWVTPDPKIQDKEGFIPYNKELGLLQTDTGFWDTPVKDKGTIYLDAQKFAPLVNRKEYAAEFDIPEDLMNSEIGRAIAFAQLAQFKDVLKKLDSLKALLYIFGAITALAIIAAFLITYSDNKAIHDMAGQVGNMSRQMARINP